ncbi:MAG: OmpA family protein [Rhodospirillales bacterium]|nr:MAG: OmpA family protein [Rhodospirillales bacterium]
MRRIFPHSLSLGPTVGILLAVLLAGCTDYGVPGGDRPWPELSDFPERPDTERMDERRRRLIGKYGDPADALPEPAETPDRPPADALQVAVIQFDRADQVLDEQSLEIIEQVAAYAQQSRAAIWLFAYTSRHIELASGGNPRLAAQSLSASRVRAVALALIRAGVPADKIELIARGARDPVFMETSETGQAGNRRVEIYFVK